MNHRPLTNNPNFRFEKNGVHRRQFIKYNIGSFYFDLHLHHKIWLWNNSNMFDIKFII